MEKLVAQLKVTNLFIKIVTKKHEKIRQPTSNEKKGKFLGMSLTKWKKFSKDEWNQGHGGKFGFGGRGNMCENLTCI